MQSFASLGRALYRIVFRGGSPQRIQYSDRLMVVSMGSFAALLVASQRFFYAVSFIEIGLMVFTTLTGIYIGSALLTRKAPRMRIRTTLLAGFLLLSAAQLILLILTPFNQLASWIQPSASLAVGVAVLVGFTNILQYALASSRSRAALTAVAFAISLSAFYLTMQWLLRMVFS